MNDRVFGVSKTLTDTVLTSSPEQGGGHQTTGNGVVGREIADHPAASGGAGCDGSACPPSNEKGWQSPSAETATAERDPTARPIPAEKPSVRCSSIAESWQTLPNLPPVTSAGQMTPNGWKSENHAFIDYLTELTEQGRVGRDPMMLPVELLARAGHPPRATRRLVGAIGDIPMVDEPRRHKDLRRHCLTCAESAGEVRRCTVIDCPLWPYRMGRNPHNPRRGRDPFAVGKPVRPRRL